MGSVDVPLNSFYCQALTGPLPQPGLCAEVLGGTRVEGPLSLSWGSILLYVQRQGTMVDGNDSPGDALSSY